MHLPHHTRTRASALQALLVLTAVLVIGLVLAGVALARSLRAPPHAFPDLRAEVFSKLKLNTRSDVEVNVPPILFSLARLVSRVAPVEPEARSAMRTVRGAQVGVYELTDRPDRPTCLQWIETADEHCKSSGWQRVVCVLDQQDLVLVYLSDTTVVRDQVDVFVMVLDDRDLVTASVRGNLDSLTDLVSTALSRHGDELLAAMH